MRICRSRRTSDHSSAAPPSSRADIRTSARLPPDHVQQTSNDFGSSWDYVSDTYLAATKCGCGKSADTNEPPSNVNSPQKPIFETLTKFDAIRRQSQAASEENARRFLMRSQQRIKQQRQMSTLKTCLERLLLSVASNEAAADSEAARGNTVAMNLLSSAESGFDVSDNVDPSATSDDVIDENYNRRETCARREHSKEATSGAGFKCRNDDVQAMRTSSQALQPAAAAVNRLGDTRSQRSADIGASSPMVPTTVVDVRCPLTVNESFDRFDKIRKASLEAQQKNYRSLKHKLRPSSVTAKTSRHPAMSQNAPNAS